MLPWVFWLCWRSRLASPQRDVIDLQRLRRAVHAWRQRRGPSSSERWLSISLCGVSLSHWQAHLWLHKLPIPALGNVALAETASHDHLLRLVVPAGVGACVALNLEWPPQERLQHWLEHLRSHSKIWDPDLDRVQRLSALGLPALWLDPAGPSNGWLQQTTARDSQAWASQLGLAPPEPGSLLVLGAAGSDWDRALAAEATQTLPSTSPLIRYLPGWPELVCTSAAEALALAGWLGVAVKQSAALVCMQSEPEPALQTLRSDPAVCVSLRPPLTPEDLRAELAGQPLLALAEDRPSPPLQDLFFWERSDAIPLAGVVISLHNYGDRIAAALDSVAAQRQHQLELIVVDDASEDDGPDVVKAWMQAHSDLADLPFVRLRLLRHCRNAGLATARNTAFTAALAPWCFVLDADNALYPDAVAGCLALVGDASDALAVVHPLLAVEAEPGRPDDQRSLVSTAAWQRQRMLGGNVVDAMALVRRSAWQAVGGYTHIEGGWEDFDFWCKLIAAGYHGVQCPRVLAVYRSHAMSMSHTATNRSWRALSRTLQQRHPWLNLPLAR